MNFNKVIIGGNLTRDPEVRWLPGDTAVAQFGVAVKERWKNKQTNEYEQRATFVDCVAFGKSAELVGKYFNKGSAILIEGKLRLEQWKDKQSGQDRSKLKVVVDSFEFVAGKRGDDDAEKPGSDASASEKAPPAKHQHEPLPAEDIPF